MAWSYSGPQGSNKDVVRYLIQDTDSHRPLLLDEEILWQLSQTPNPRRAAIECCEQLALRFAMRPDIRDEGTTITYSNMAENFRLLARQLRQQEGLFTAIPFAGGISQSDKGTRETDTDRVQPAFSRTLFDSEERG